MSTVEALKQVMENGVIPVRLEEDVVRFRVGRLYASPASGFRELYANELRACRIARDKHGANPRIEITVNHADRMLTIHGIDSLGITENHFINTLSVLGETDNQDGTEVGQWGWGMAAAATLSDSVTYETYARETGEKYGFFGISGEHFSKLPQPNLDTPGTRVTVYLRDDINLVWLIHQIRHICAIADVPTILTQTSSSPGEGLLQSNSVPEQINEPDIALHVPADGTRVEADDDDFALVGVFEEEHLRLDYYDRSQTHSKGPIADVRLLSMPIEANLRFPFDACILQIKSEREYRPTADRERLTDEAAERLAAKIREHLVRTLPQALDINSFDEFRKKPCKHLYFTLADRHSAYDYYSSKEKQSLHEVYTPSARTMELVSLLCLTVRVLSGTRRDRYTGSRKTVTQERLGDIVASSENIFLVNSLDTQLQETLRTRYSDAALIAPILPNSRYRRNGLIFSFDTTEALRAQGIRMDAHAEAQAIKDAATSTHHIAPHHSGPINEEMCHVIVHTSRIRTVEEHGTEHAKLADQSIQHMLRDVDPNTLFVPNIEKYLPILQELDSKRGLARLDKLPKKSQQHRLTLERFLREQADHKVTTNHGRLTFKAIVNLDAPINILLYSDSRIAEHYKGPGILVPLGEDTAFELTVYLRANQKPYTIAHVPSEEEFEQTTQRSRWDYHHHDETYNSDTNLTVNRAYHIGLAVKDARIRQLFLAAGTEASTTQLEELLNFCLDADRRLQTKKQ